MPCLVALLAVSCGRDRLSPLELPLQGFEEQLLPEGCKQDSTRKIGDGIFKNRVLQTYDCEAIGVHVEIVIEGTGILKYAMLMPTAMFKDPRVVAAERDRDLRFVFFGNLYTAAKNVPKGELLNVLKEKGPVAFDIPLEHWKECVRLGVPMSSTLDGYTYSCDVENGDTVRFSVAPEGTYLKEKSLRIRGGQSEDTNAANSSGPDVLPKITGPRDCRRIDIGMTMNQVNTAMGQKLGEPADIALLVRDPNGPMGMGMPISGYGLERKEFMGNLDNGFSYWYVLLSCTVEISPRTARVSRVRRHVAVPLAANPKGSEFPVYTFGRIAGFPTPQWASGKDEVRP